MRMERLGWWWLVLVVLVGGCSTDTTEPVFNNPLDPENSTGMEPPDSVGVLVGSNQVQLVWTGPAGEELDGYIVLRRRLDVVLPEPMERVTETSDTTYVDNQVRNGRIYAYEIAAGLNGTYGKRSEEVEARPGLFTVVLANDAPWTSQTTVSVSLGAPSATEAVQLSEDPGFANATWRRVTANTSWVFEQGDGERTVYARYQLSDGTESFPVYDSIELDTRAVVTSVSFDGNNVKSPGETIHFRVEAGEPEGRATVDVPGLFTALPLFDDGTGGDAIANDGIYERELAIPAGSNVADARITGKFYDRAGNSASPVNGTRTLTVRRAPEAVTLVELVVSNPPDPTRVTIRWTQSLESDFASYRIYRDVDPEVDTADELAGSVTSQTMTEYADGLAVEGVQYYYRVYVRTKTGLVSGSNSLAVHVPNVRPPSTVTLNSPDGVGYTRLALRWSQSGDRDFAAYRVYRNETGAVDDQDDLVAEITDVTTTYVDDLDLVENTRYHYRVYVVDTADLTSRSNEVEGRTQNESPPSVVLEPAEAVVDTAATLAWSESDAHDFQSYRLYRSESPAVSTSSHLVADIIDRDGTSYRDTDLLPSTRYYYRVFVRDDGPQPESTGSNVIDFVTPAAR